MRALAGLLGGSVHTLRRLAAEKLIEPVEPARGRRGARWDPLDVARRLLAHRAQELPRDQRDRAQAAWLDLRLAKERRELLPRAEVVRDGQAFVTATMAKIRALPSRLVRAGLIAPAAEPVVAELLREAQEEIARWQTHLDLLNAVDEGPA